MQQKIERLQAQLGDLKGKRKDTSSVSDTRNSLSQKLKNKNVELEFQVLNYARENAHLKATYKNPFDSISVSRAQTKTIIAFLQNELQDNTKTRRPQCRSNTKHDRVPSASKTSRSKNKEAEVEEHHRNLLLYKNNKHISSACNNIQIDSQDVISKVVCAMCKKCLISVNHDKCLHNYVNGKNSCGKNQKAKVSVKEIQMKYQPKVAKPKNVGTLERLATPKPGKPRFLLRWSPTGRLFDQEGKLAAFGNSESQYDFSNGDNAFSSNAMEPKIKRFPNSTSLLDRKKQKRISSTQTSSKLEAEITSSSYGFVWTNENCQYKWKAVCFGDCGRLLSLHVDEDLSDDTTPSVARKFLNEVKSTIVTLQRVVKQRMTIETHNWASSAHQELHKIAREEFLPIVNQVDARVEIQFLKEAAKFVGDFKSLAKEADASLAKHKILKLDIEHLLKAVLFKKVSDQKDKNQDSSKNTKFAKQPIAEIFPKISETNALSKPVTSNSVSTPHESKGVNNAKVIALGMFRISLKKVFREAKKVPNTVSASSRTKPIIVSQPSVITKKGMNSNSNGFSSIRLDNTKIRRPQPRSNTKNDRVPSKSKSSRSKNKEVKVEEHHRNLLLSKKNKPSSSAFNHDVCLNYVNGKKSRGRKHKANKCLISVNHDKCLHNYVNGKNSRGKQQKANVSFKENQMKYQPKVAKPKKVGTLERLATPKPRKPRFLLRWSPTGRLFDQEGKLAVSSNSESQYDCSIGD
nr:hypothetical protein [Tanacetum cinerariifolium]